ncbi:hypothetical protein [Vibrio vulnificus YJ016]|uniref:Uncharacterized protein n=1 Tax=Vibrio vulnificus (strain YJ016) TaxID=196600 RepID=Q7MFB2_VIBVY|nr:hypothetical protein [Vibrio vulnificus YJ016]
MICHDSRLKAQRKPEPHYSHQFSDSHKSVPLKSKNTPPRVQSGKSK